MSVAKPGIIKRTAAIAIAAPEKISYVGFYFYLSSLIQILMYLILRILHNKLQLLL